MEYTKNKPKVPGWYWCRRLDIEGPRGWEAIVRVDLAGVVTGRSVEDTKLELACSFLSAPGQTSFSLESDWVDHAEWAGPIHSPEMGPDRDTRIAKAIDELQDRESSQVTLFREAAGKVQVVGVEATWNRYGTIGDKLWRASTTEEAMEAAVKAKRVVESADGV